MTPFIFELAVSSTLARLGALDQARDRKLTVTLNKAGAFDMRLPLTNKMALLVNEVSTCVIIKMKIGGNYVPVWSGPVWTVEETTPNTLQVGCVGWFQTLEKKISKPSWATPSGALTYTATDAGAIAHDLLAKVIADTGGTPVYLSVGSRVATQNRTRTYQPYINVLDEIFALSQIESGYDMLVDPATRALNIYAKLQTTPKNLFFEFNNNVVRVSRSSDSSKICNRMIAYSPAGAAQADDPVSQAAYGVMEEAVSLSDVNDIAILQAYANGEVAVRSTPFRQHSFDPRESSAAHPGDPVIFRDFNIGDIGYLKAKKGRLNIPKQAVRLFGATVDFQPNGATKLSNIQTTVA